MSTPALLTRFSCGHETKVVYQSEKEAQVKRANARFHVCPLCVSDTILKTKGGSLDWYEEEIFFDRQRELSRRGKEVAIVDRAWMPAGFENSTMHYRFYTV